ncbi:MAG: hypothetical protein M0R03_04835 [Novosphingobium sp.]|nr:hypothetical protein [Novosphingobium sp.]
MVDYFALAVSHGLMALAAWRLMLRRELDSEPGLPDSGPGAGIDSGREKQAPARRSADA